MQNKITWVLLRGLMREHRHWGDFPELLKQTFPNSQILTPDLPGSGRRNKETSPSSINAIMEKVRDDVVNHSHSHPYYLVGLSLGAMTAIEWAKCYPNEIAGGVLMSTSLRGINPLFHRLRPANYPSIIRNIFLSNDIQRNEETILKLTSNKHASDKELLNSWIQYAKESGMTRSNGLRQLLAASRYSAPATKPDIPLILLNGREDHLVNPTCSNTIASRWKVPLLSHPHAGHDLTLDAGKWVCEQIQLWLDKPA